MMLMLVLALTLISGIYKLNFSKDESVFTGAKGPKDATYRINGQTVTLKNGIAEVEVAPGGTVKIVTRYFGNEVKHDFDGDGRKDAAFLLTQETGGSGTFFYVVAALNTANGYVGSEGLFLGDRIAPQTTERGKGNIVLVNYAERKPGESFAVRPSVGKSIWLILDPKTMQFAEVAQNFEGEADPARMTLGMKTWNWVSTTYSNDRVIKPRDSQKFALTFKDGKTFSATTDCNGVGGEYAVTGDKISFNKMMSTLMYCDGSQEADFSKSLGEAVRYHFTPRGELIFGLKYESGVMVFR